jgi:tRNA-dihydrouridine synthase
LLLYLAPIRGITDCIFRTIFADHFRGFDSALAPFIPTIKGRTVKRSHIRDVLPENNRALPIVPQILGNNPIEFVALSKKLFDLGHQKVNWNVGCPFPQVTKKKRGSGLLPHPERIKSFLDHVMARIPNKLSIKTRLGLVSKDEMEGWLPVVNDYPLAEIIMHPRTGKQLYEGTVDLEGFEQFANASVNPVVYNGDIWSKESLSALQQRFPKINKWMIGRGAIANPLLAEILRGREPDAAHIYPRIKCFHDDLLDAYVVIFKNSGSCVDKMKGIWYYLSRSFPEGKAFLKRIQKVKRMEHYKELVEEIFSFHKVMCV